ncbi:hypothetical protein ACWCQK_41515 [Streptomyces sp. NPDC002306]
MRLVSFFEQNGWEVLSAHHEEPCSQSIMAAKRTRRDFHWIRSCDLYVAFPGDPASPKTHVEIGWASALQCPTILILEDRENHAFSVRGLGEIAPTVHLTYGSGPEFLESLAQAVADFSDDLDLPYSTWLKPRWVSVCTNVVGLP